MNSPRVKILASTCYQIDSTVVDLVALQHEVQTKATAATVHNLNCELGILLNWSMWVNKESMTDQQVDKALFTYNKLRALLR